ncbi:MAG: Stf0 family sulfotransferase [Hyphomicrobiales bacterium]
MYIPPLIEGRHASRIGAVMAMPVFAPAMAAGIDTQLSVFICFTNRCGSNFLADLLAATGLLPRGGEFFNAPAVLNRSRAAGITGFDFYCRLLHQKNAKSDRFVAKASIDQLAMLARLGYLGSLFPNPHFIHIHRYDLVAQAVSFLLASHTKEWTARQENPRADDGVQYDGAKIAAHIERVNLKNALIRQFLQVNRLRYLAVQYEHLAAMPDHTIAMIADWLCLGPAKIDPKRLKVARQASDLKRQFYERYLTETAEAGS